MSISLVTDEMERLARLGTQQQVLIEKLQI